MPIVTNTRVNSIVKPVATTTPEVITTISPEEAPVSSVVVDTTWMPRQNLITHVEGASWTVEYFSQVLTKDSALSGQQLTVSAVYQQYKRIHKFELKVSSALSTSQDEETKEMSVNGQAIVYPFIVPNDGDMFIADIGQGKQALFRINSTVKKSIFNESCYEVSYVLDTDDQEKMAALRDKAIEELFFHKDRVVKGEAPLLRKKEHDAVLELEKQYRLMIYRYFEKFFSKEYKTFIVPDQPQVTYDGFIVDFILSSLDSTAHINHMHTRKLQVNEDEYLTSDNILTAILHQDLGRLNYAFTKAGLVFINQFLPNPTVNGLYYSGAKQIVYPKDFDKFNVAAKQLNGLSLQDDSTRQTNNILLQSFNLRETTDTSAVSIPVIDHSTGYIFSSNFYDKNQSQSNLETMVWDYLEFKSLDKEQLIDTTARFDHWSPLCQFYYAPVILHFIKYALTN